MSTSKFLIFLGLILALPVVAWSPGNALAQEKAARAVAIEQAKKAVREQVRNDIAIKGKGKVTINDQAKFFGKVTPADQKAAAKSDRQQLGLYPGIAGRTAQALGVAAPAAKAPGVAVPAAQKP